MDLSSSLVFCVNLSLSEFVFVFLIQLLAVPRQYDGVGGMGASHITYAGVRGVGASHNAMLG